MKIVKFKNGNYGIRKWSWFWGWVFALNNSGRWDVKGARWVQEFSTLETAEKVFNNILKAGHKDKDMGTPLDKEKADA